MVNDLRVPLHMATAQQREVIEHFAARSRAEDALAQHRPGPRYIVDEAARARVEQARAEGIKAMCDAWKRKPMQHDAAVASFAASSPVTSARSTEHRAISIIALSACPTSAGQDAVPRTMDACHRAAYPGRGLRGVGAAG